MYARVLRLPGRWSRIQLSDRVRGQGPVAELERKGATWAREREPRRQQLWIGPACGNVTRSGSARPSQPCRGGGVSVSSVRVFAMIILVAVVTPVGGASARTTSTPTPT